MIELVKFVPDRTGRVQDGPPAFCIIESAGKYAVEALDYKDGDPRRTAYCETLADALESVARLMRAQPGATYRVE